MNRTVKAMAILFGLGLVLETIHIASLHGRVTALEDRVAVLERLQE